MKKSDPPRYAIYYAPDPTSALWRFGCAVIGYDASVAREVAFLTTADTTREAWSELTAEPRRYGFHATLKAPFRLASGTTEAELIAAVGTLAEALSPMKLEMPAVRALTRFVALTPGKAPDDLQRLASRIVVSLDRFRAPLSDIERERRQVATLTPRQLAYLERYGYPYVNEDFRFHMTLTGPLPVDRLHRVASLLQADYVRLVPSGAIGVDALAVFRQAKPTERFTIISRCLFGPATEPAGEARG